VQFLEQLKSILVSKTFGLWPNRQLCLTNLTLSDSKTEKNLNVRIVQKNAYLTNSGGKTKQNFDVIQNDCSNPSQFLWFK
jgi:hypothetical protein